VNGIPTTGYGIFRDNYFGHTYGFNDTIDFTGGNRPSAILQIINNVFDGASDDHLDLDSTDAWIEGNIFMHAHRDPSRTDNALDTASAISGGAETVGQNPDWTIINNIFYDVDHVFLNKGNNTTNGNGGGRVAFLYNTVIHVAKEYSGSTAAEISPSIGVMTTSPCPMRPSAPVSTPRTTLFTTAPLCTVSTTRHIHTVIMDNNILSAPWSGPGSGNQVVDPLLNLGSLGTTSPTNVTVAQLRQAVQLRPGSPAIGKGFGGLNLGGLFSVSPKPGEGPAATHGIVIAGEPPKTTPANSALLTVGLGGTFNWGTTAPQRWGWTAFRWKLDSGPFSGEILVTNNSPFTNPPTITLSNLSNGTHTLYVSGKNDAGFYQDDPFVYTPTSGIPALLTASRTWVVNTNLPRVVINEVLARNSTAVPVGSKFPDLVELYNSGSTAVDSDRDGTDRRTFRRI
jgi:hypothetical protein